MNLTRKTFIKSFAAFVAMPLFPNIFLPTDYFKKLCKLDYDTIIKNSPREPKDLLRKKMQEELNINICFDNDTPSSHQSVNDITEDTLKNCDILLFYNSYNDDLVKIKNHLGWDKEQYPRIKKTMKICVYDKNYRYDIVG